MNKKERNDNIFKASIVFAILAILCLITKFQRSFTYVSNFIGFHGRGKYGSGGAGAGGVY
ncbi:MAG: hypothetical protein RLN81_12640 [Balneolaceae bacterium]